MTELLNSTEGKPLTLEELTIRVKTIEKVLVTLLEILNGGDVDKQE